MPELHFSFDNFLGIGEQALAIETGRCSAHHELMLDFAHSEAAAPEIANFKRRISQFVVICKNILTPLTCRGFFKAF